MLKRIRGFTLFPGLKQIAKGDGNIQVGSCYDPTGIKIFEEEFVNEGLADIEEAVMDAVNDSPFPQDEHGFDNVVYTITIHARPEK
jgi:hypothetical protein